MVTNTLRFKKHKDLSDSHAILSASQNAWQRYSQEKLEQFLVNRRKATEGTALHEQAEHLINFGLKLDSAPEYASHPHKKALTNFVNFAIDNGMTSEVTLVYNQVFYGKADGIVFDLDTKTLIIADLKTGVGEVKKFDQFETYAILYMAEYPMYQPEHISLNIFQGAEHKHKLIEGEELEQLRKYGKKLYERADYVLKETN